MSIASEITRLQGCKADIRTALVNKGITSASTHNMADFATDISNISAGGATITVSYTSTFYNKTMTCSDGTTTYTKTTTSSGTTSFNVTDEGTWTITCNGISRTVNVVLNYALSMAITKTVTLYSAVQDTVSFTDATGSKTCRTGNDGSVSVSITFVPDQSITFTSSVAKKPDNLSNNYSKTITMTNNTTSVYVMPDNALYWYGCQVQPWDTTTLVFVGNGSWTNTPMSFNTNNMSQTLSGTLKTANASISHKVTFDGKLTAILSCSISNSGAIQKVQATSKTVSDKYMSITANFRGSGYNSSNITCCFSSTSGTTDGSDKTNFLESLSGSSMTTTLYALWVE